MQENIEAIAIISGSSGKIGPIGGHTQEQFLGVGRIGKCDDFGKFEYDGLSGEVTEVEYSVIGKRAMGVAIIERGITIPFSDYMEMGRPSKLSIKLSATIESHS